jgi:hypothetical protein
MPYIYRAIKCLPIASQMAPTFSEVAVVATPQMTVISGLRCGHAGCYALFSTFEDSEEHALNAHSGNLVAVTCNIHEKKINSGRVQLYRILDEDGEEGLQNTFTGAYSMSQSLSRLATTGMGNFRPSLPCFKKPLQLKTL